MEFKDLPGFKNLEGIKNVLELYGEKGILH